MPLGITQGELQRFSAQMMPLLPTVPLWYRESGWPQDVGIEVAGAWIRPTEDEKALDVALQKRRTLRCGLQSFSTRPALDAMLDDVNGPRWQVKSVTGGPPGHAFWFLHCQQVG